jgi:hypothetical protein
MATAAQALALDRFNLMRFGGKGAFWIGSRNGCWCRAGIAPAERGTPVGTPEGIAHWLIAHRERRPTLPTVDPQQAGKQAHSCGGCSARPATPTPELDREVSRHRTMSLFGTRFDDPARYAAPLRRDEPRLPSGLHL